MKYILLDIDGVLSSDAFTRQCILEHRRENLFGVDWFDPACVVALRKIVDETGAQIVVSSSWRELGKEKLQRLWEHNGMPGKLAGATPIWILTKREAIEYWIQQHPDDRHVIIDDADLGLPNQVRTDPKTGLTGEDAEKAINNFLEDNA